MGRAVLVLVATMFVAASVFGASAGASRDVSGSSPAQDRTTAEQAVLKVADVPAGWKATDSQEPRKKADAIRAQIGACKAYGKFLTKLRSLPNAFSQGLAAQSSGA